MFAALVVHEAATAAVSNSPIAVFWPGARNGAAVSAGFKANPNQAKIEPSGLASTPPMPPVPSGS